MRYGVSASLLLLLSYTAIPAYTAVPAAVVDRVAVTVGKDVITETELLEEIRVTALLNGDEPDFSPEARRAAAERLVDQILIRREMDIAGYPQPTAGDVESMLRKFKTQRFSGDSDYKAGLTRYGLNEGELKAHLKWQLAVLRFTEQRFAGSGQPASPGATAPKGSAERAGSDGDSGAPAAPRSGATLRANRSARPETPDQQLDAWLREARANARVVFVKEAFR